MNFEYSVVKGLAEEYKFDNFSYQQIISTWYNSKRHEIYMAKRDNGDFVLESGDSFEEALNKVKEKLNETREPIS